MITGLEIINKYISKIEESIKEEPSQLWIDFKSYQLKEYKIIKEELEVLEILKVLISHNFKSVGTRGFISDFEVMYRLGKITQEQLDIIKKWAKENENETK